VGVPTRMQNSVLSATCSEVLFVEMGFGNDGHGQDVTKAAVRAARNAIEFNSIPSIRKIIPGGYDAMKLDVILAVPPKYQGGLRVDEVKNVFPYGKCHVTIQDGGEASSEGREERLERSDSSIPSFSL